MLFGRKKNYQRNYRNRIESHVFFDSESHIYEKNNLLILLVIFFFVGIPYIIAGVGAGGASAGGDVGGAGGGGEALRPDPRPRSRPPPPPGARRRRRYGPAGSQKKFISAYVFFLDLPSDLDFRL